MPWWSFQGLTVEPQTILDVSGAVPEAAVEALMKACRSNSFAEVQQAITNAIADGFPVSAACIRLCNTLWPASTAAASNSVHISN